MARSPLNRPDAVRPQPLFKLTEAEPVKIIEVCNMAKYASLPPSQIVPKLLEDAEYDGSESTIYWVLKTFGQLHHRRRSLAPKVSMLPMMWPKVTLRQNRCQEKI